MKNHKDGFSHDVVVQHILFLAINLPIFRFCQLKYGDPQILEGLYIILLLSYQTHCMCYSFNMVIFVAFFPAIFIHQKYLVCYAFIL